MKIALQRIESIVKEDALLKAEELLEQEVLKPLYEIEKQLWVTEIQAHEVEVQLSGRNVTGGSCDCTTFSDRGECEHFVAAMLQLRRQIKPPKPVVNRQKRARNTQKLTTTVVLEQVNREELIEFVKEYARTNRSFGIALKAKFASSVSQIDQEDKYHQLLDSTISSVRKSDRTISIRGGQKLLKVLEELDAQLTEAIVEKDLVEASFMARSIIEKISPLLGKVSGKKAEVRKQVVNAFQHLANLLRQEPAPDLIRAIKVFIDNQYHRLAYRPSGLDIYFIKLLQQIAKTEAEYEEVMEAIATLKEKYEREDRIATSLLLAEINVLEKAGKTAEAKKMMEQNLNEPDVLYYAIKQAQERKQRPRIKALAEIGLKFDFLAKDEARLTNLLLEMAEEDGDTEAISQYALARFMDSLDFSFYRKARNHSDDTWNDRVEVVIERLKNRPYSFRNRSAIGKVYAEERILEPLIELLESSGSINLLIEFGGAVYKDYPERMAVLYRRLLDEYTQQHLGRKASVRVREVLAHLYEIGANKLARQIIDTLRTAYPERHSLMEELAIFQSA